MGANVAGGTYDHFSEVVSDAQARRIETEMDTDVSVVGPDASIDEVATLIFASAGHHVPVDENDKPIGMIAPPLSSSVFRLADQMVGELADRGSRPASIIFSASLRSL